MKKASLAAVVILAASSGALVAQCNPQNSQRWSVVAPIPDAGGNVTLPEASGRQILDVDVTSSSLSIKTFKIQSGCKLYFDCSVSSKLTCEKIVGA